MQEAGRENVRPTSQPDEAAIPAKPDSPATKWFRRRSGALDVASGLQVLAAGNIFAFLVEVLGFVILCLGGFSTDGRGATNLAFELRVLMTALRTLAALVIIIGGMRCLYV